MKLGRKCYFKDEDPEHLQAHLCIQRQTKHTRSARTSLVFRVKNVWVSVGWRPQGPIPAGPRQMMASEYRPSLCCAQGSTSSSGAPATSEDLPASCFATARPEKPQPDVFPKSRAAPPPREQAAGRGKNREPATGDVQGREALPAQSRAPGAWRAPSISCVKLPSSEFCP